MPDDLDLAGLRRWRAAPVAPPLLVVISAIVIGCSPAGDLPLASDVEIVSNPGNPLSATVRWTTVLSSEARVEFGQEGGLEWFVEAQGWNTEHELVVVGMRPDTTYTLEAVYADEDGWSDRSAPMEFTTGSFPLSDLVLQPTVLDPARTAPGWTLANVAVNGVEAPVVVAMFDAEGFPVWVHTLDDGFGGRGDIDASLLDESRVLIGGGVAPGSPVEVDLAGNVVWRGPSQTDGDFLAEGQMHHLLQKLSNGHYLTLTWEYAAGVYDALVQFDAAGLEIWRWDAADHLPAEALDDYIWGNAALADLDENVAYYNGVANGTLYKIDRADGAVLWELGTGGDFVHLHDHEYPWFWGAHGPEIQPDGNLLVYDNGRDDRGFARVLELALDEEARTAEIVFEYPPDGVDDHFANPQWGDADRLANGNTLVTAGSTFGAATPSRLFELTSDGEKVWEVWFESLDTEVSFGAYAADRVPALVQPIED
jgi:hypothetical protein